MGKFRGHQDKSRRGREKKLLKKKAGAAAGGIRATAAQAESVVSGGDSLSSPSRQQQQKQRGAVGAKRKLKHVTYAKEHSVLIVGDGDFSFTRGVIRHRGTGAGVVATSLDSEKAVLKKYPRAETWLPKLEADGAQVAHSVDATRLEETLLGAGGGRGDAGEEVSGEKKRVLFDRVVFNFPHTGAQRTHLNRNLIRDFFASTKGLVKCAAAGGEVHVTLKDKPPYSGWNVKAMARESELVMVRCLAFDPSVFPGYRHSTTDPQAKKFDAGGARTNVFCRARSELDDNVDESGAFPVIVRPGGAASSVSGQPVATANNAGNSNKSDDDDNVDGNDISSEGDNASDCSDLFGGGGSGGSGDPDGGLGSWDDEEGKSESKDASEGAGDDARSSDGVDRAVADANGKTNRGKKKKKTSETGGGSGVPSGSEAEGVDEGKGVASNGASKRGMLQPPVQKKKAAKRRAQRKRKAAAAKEAAAATAAAAEGTPRDEGLPQEGVSGNKAKSPKRKRGKYVVSSAKKRPRD
ncbi:unnamed protein product [Ectocarpus fasciculatus]